jgi:hypothetical protein
MINALLHNKSELYSALGALPRTAGPNMAVVVGKERSPRIYMVGVGEIKLRSPAGQRPHHSPRLDRDVGSL